MSAVTFGPASATVHDVARLVPETSSYVLKRSKRLREHFGVWNLLDSYQHAKTSEDIMQSATGFYTGDNPDKFRHSPDKKDAVNTTKDAELQIVSKRYMTRPI